MDSKNGIDSPYNSHSIKHTQFICTEPLVSGMSGFNRRAVDPLSKVPPRNESSLRGGKKTKSDILQMYPRK
jgi:hypothetical protein